MIIIPKTHDINCHIHIEGKPKNQLSTILGSPNELFPKIFKGPRENKIHKIIKETDIKNLL